LEDALDDALETLDDALDSTIHLLLAFASPEYEPHLLHLGPSITKRHPGAVVIGCTAAGVIGGGMEVETGPALSLTGARLPGVEINLIHFDSDPDQWTIPVSPDYTPAFVMLADPFTCPAEDVLRWLDTLYPRSAKIGGLASGGYAPGGIALFSQNQVVRSGAVGVTLHGDIEVSTIVAQGCRPIGHPVFVTRAQENLITELDGQPALEMLESVYNQLSSADQERFRQSLYIGLVMDDAKESYRQGDFLVRNLIGVAPELGGIAVAGEVSQVVQFHLRDAHTSAEDLSSMLARHGQDTRSQDTPSGALLFSCLGRGTGLYGHANHDSEMFRERFGDAALGGFFCNGEIGPVGGRTFLHGYTSSFGLFSPKRRS
jgi:small ligand-binding sensory domain FIST